MSVLQWDKHQSEILNRLQNRSKFKICCKTLSEPEFIQDWIRHHSAIVGPENLIIADNGSRMLLRSKCMVVSQAILRYSSFPDRITTFTGIQDFGRYSIASRTRSISFPLSTSTSDLFGLTVTGGLLMDGS